MLDGIAYFAGCDEVFRAVRASDGKVVFEAPIGAYTGASVALDAGTAYFGTFDNEVLALDLKTHTLQVALQASGTGVPVLLVGGGRRWQGGRRRARQDDSRASTRRRARRVWTYMTRARVESSPAVAGSRVYVGSGDGRFYVLRSGDRRQAVGVPIWAGPLSASPAMANGRIVIGSQDGRLVCFG